MASTVLITGASQGSGKATAHLFAQNGYSVVLAARQADRLEVVAQDIRAQGGDALAIPTDVTNPQQVQELVDRSLSHYRHLDVLINNAGICLTGSVDKTELSDWHQLMDTNFFGYVYTIEAILPQNAWTQTSADTAKSAAMLSHKTRTMYCRAERNMGKESNG